MRNRWSVLIVLLVMVLWCPMVGQAATSWELLYTTETGAIIEIDTSRYQGGTANGIYEGKVWIRHRSHKNTKYENISQLGVRVNEMTGIYSFKIYQGAIYRKGKVVQNLSYDDWDDTAPDSLREQLCEEVYKFAHERFTIK